VPWPLKGCTVLDLCRKFISTDTVLTRTACRCGAEEDTARRGRLCAVCTFLLGKVSAISASKTTMFSETMAKTTLTLCSAQTDRMLMVAPVVHAAFRG
jgi:hypothetical protein